MSAKDYPVPKEILPEHKELMQGIGKQLQKIRKERKLKQEDVAKKIDSGRNTFGRIENGEIYFKFSTLLRILDYYEVSVIDFFKDLEK